MTQNKIILAALKQGERITSMGAIRKYGITRLAARIRNLKDMGYKIKAESRTVRNMQGNSTNISVYSLDV